LSISIQVGTKNILQSISPSRGCFSSFESNIMLSVFIYLANG
jgi:hypothetical protein